MPRPDITAYIDANAKGYHDALRRVRSDTDRTGQSAAMSLGNVTAALRGGAARVAALAGPVGAVAAVAGAAAMGLQRVAESVARVGDEARRAGVDVESFQELRFVAEQSRISVDALTDGMKELNLRADEYIQTGGGAAAESFERLGYNAETLAVKLKDPSALFTEIIGKLGELDKAAQIRVLDEVFGGTGGEQFMQLVERGEQALRDQIDAAHDLGQVLDEELIQKAEELDSAFRTVTQTVGVSLQKAIINAGSALLGFIESFWSFEDQRDRTLDSTMSSLGQKRIDIENEILQLRQDQRDMTDNARDLGFGEGYGNMIDKLEGELRELARQEEQILAIQKERRDRRNITPPEFIPPEPPPGDPDGSGGGGGGGGRRSITETANQEIDAYQKVSAALEEQLAMLALSEKQQRLYNAAKEAGVEVGSAEYQNLERLIEQYDSQSRAIEANRQGMEYLEQTGTEALTLLLSRTGDAEDGLKRLAAQLAVAAAQAMLLNKGPLAGLLGGGILSGGLGGGFKANTTLGAILGAVPRYANGTDNHPGGLALVGERGKELLNLPRGSQVIPNHEIRGMMSGNGGQSTVRLIMPEGWKAEVLEEAETNAVRVVEKFSGSRTFAARVHDANRQKRRGMA